MHAALGLPESIQTLIDSVDQHYLFLRKEERGNAQKLPVAGSLCFGLVNRAPYIEIKFKKPRVRILLIGCNVQIEAVG